VGGFAWPPLLETPDALGPPCTSPLSKLGGLPKLKVTAPVLGSTLAPDDEGIKLVTNCRKLPLEFPDELGKLN